MSAPAVTAAAAVSLADGPAGRSPEEARAVLAGLARPLVQRRELDPKALAALLRSTLRRVHPVLGSAGAFVLELDVALREARVVCASLAREPLPASWRRRLRALEERPLGREQLGVLGDLEALRRLDPAGPGDVPPPVASVLGVEPGVLVAVPTTLSQRLTSVLLVLGREGAPLPPEADALVEEVGRLAGRVIQRALGLGAAINEEEEARCLAVLAACPFRRLDPSFVPDPVLLERVGPALLVRTAVLPLRRLGERALEAAVANPLDVHALADFEAAAGARITRKVAAPRSDIVAVLARAYPGEVALGRAGPPRARGDLVAQLAVRLRDVPVGGELEGLDRLEGEVVDETSPPIVRLANRLIEDAYLRGASDIHVETGGDAVHVRYRIDGVCAERVALPRHVSRALTARLKIMSGLDIAERRLPQDGRIDFTRYRPDLAIDLRVSVLPMRHGEWVCLRILEKRRAALPLDGLGFSPENLAAYRAAMAAPAGMILHCGPTGAGKSMTLYAALNELRGPEVKIVTAEDPVEYTLDGIGQLQVKPKIGLTFAAALRSFLRHDPDVILVGEIRDAETARVAVQAAMTGHLLLSTLHTNDAPTSVARLVKLGVEPYLVASTLVAACAQRLVRTLCVCKRPREATPEERGLLKRSKGGAPLGPIHSARGCEHCHGRGYRGRTGIHELMVATGRLRQQAADGGPREALKELARAEGMRTLFEDGVEKVKAGVTSLDEVLRVAAPEEAV